MKTPLLAAALVLLSSIQAFGQTCGCDSHPVMASPIASCGCNQCCNRCERPLLELVEGIGFTLKTTACTIKSGVHRLFHPITYCGCNSCAKATPSCGCGDSVHSVGSYEMMEPGMEYIESTPVESAPSHPKVPSIPGPPTTPSATPQATEPSKLQTTPHKWEPVGSRPGQRPQVTRSTRSVLSAPGRANSSTTRPVTYYAPQK
ncbi:hypothetical protein DTL21_23390 [Bremerella cremea]|uniref:Uncharacterized protein n=1 Tax=Blastopirellula marina TaxID=124 RepID=A0A2S8FDR8_9BACT|nr:MULTISPECIES: hypothetical protein [Pirellulaceae]PQO30307.1 hypothetical protein C5Y83_23355 [Blastopirellula marina]RCS43658.1 hypothetical protein DTL21_23390 [Bremerella cremea]